LKNIFICTGNKGKLSEFSAFLNGVSTANVYGLKELSAQGWREFVEPEENQDTFLGNALIKLLTSLQYVAKNQNQSTTFAIDEVLVDDSGLCVPALNFTPGVHSATYGGLPRSDEKNRIELRKAIAVEHEHKNKVSDNQLEQRLPGFFVCFLLQAKLSPSLLQGAANMNLNQLPFSSLVELERNLFAKAVEACQSKMAGGSLTHELLLKNLGMMQADLLGNLNIHFGYCCGEVSTLEQNLIPNMGHGYDSLFYGAGNPQLSFASVSLEEKNRVSHRAFALQAFLNANTSNSKRM
jgi:inosine/xanthosine triphosphate pyrophosphatase family protein